MSLLGWALARWVGVGAVVMAVKILRRMGPVGMRLTCGVGVEHRLGGWRACSASYEVGVGVGWHGCCVVKRTELPLGCEVADQQPHLQSAHYRIWPYAYDVRIAPGLISETLFQHIVLLLPQHPPIPPTQAPYTSAS